MTRQDLHFGPQNPEYKNMRNNCQYSLSWQTRPLANYVCSYFFFLTCVLSYHIKLATCFYCSFLPYSLSSFLPLPSCLSVSVFTFLLPLLPTFVVLFPSFPFPFSFYCLPSFLPFFFSPCFFPLFFSPSSLLPSLLISLLHPSFLP